MDLVRAARLLAAARTPDGLAALARLAGVDAPFEVLPHDSCRRLAPGRAVEQAQVAAGPGPLRALAAVVRGPPLRDTAGHIARHLTTSAPVGLWLLALHHAGDGTSALVAWHPGPRGPRVAALHFAPAYVAPSDADTLRTLAARARAARGPGPEAALLVHAAWLDALGRDALGTRFYRLLETTVRALADSLPASVASPADRNDLALLCTTRVLFLGFLEAKGWLDGDRAFLGRHFDARMAAGGHVHARTLRPLFFGTLNTPRRRRAPEAQRFGRVPFLNGGLFAPTALERRHRRAHLGDAPLGTLVHTLLAGHRFTAREDAAAWSDAAVDPEMLGRAFESLMAARERQATGAFYTPRTLVEHATSEALRHALSDPAAGVTPSDVDAALAGRSLPPGVARALHARASAIRVLDPACGSGAFLVHALERLADLLAACGDRRPLADRRQAVLTHSVFGVDVNPTAVWLCELRLWLSVVVEREVGDPHQVPPLPNLDHNVRVGDALAAPAGSDALALTHGGATWGGAPWGVVADGAATNGQAFGVGGRRPHGGGSSSPSRPGRVADLRARYAALAGPRKAAAARRLDAAERAHAVAVLDASLTRLRHLRAEALTAARARDLFGERRPPDAAARRRLTELRAAVRAAAARRRAAADGAALPFGFGWHFADAAAAGGFDLLLGNPPWVRPHALDPAARAPLRARYAVARESAWPATAVRAGRPQFGAQVDLAALFTERALALTRPGGVTALLVPAKLWRTLAGGALRTLVLRESHVLALDDWSDAPTGFDAAVYPSLLVARRGDEGAGDTRHAPHPANSTPPNGAPPPKSTRVGSGTPAAAVRVHRGRAAAPEYALATLPLDPAAPASPWLLLPPDVRQAFDALRAAGPPLGETALPRPTLGVKCGCNEAFLVTVDGVGHDLVDGAVARVRRGDRVGTIEHAILRPTLRGEHLAPTAPGSLLDVRGAPDSAGAEHLVWTHGSDGRPIGALPPHAARWLAPWRDRLDARTDARGPGPWWGLFRTDGAATDRPRVVWPDLARVPHPRILPAGDPTAPLNTCYVARFDDERDARAFAALLAAPPVGAWLAALAEPARGGYRRFLAWTVALLPIPSDWPAARGPLAELGPTAAPDRLTAAVSAAYGVAPARLAPLLAWSGVAAADPPRPPAIRERSVPPDGYAPPLPPGRRVREPARATRHADARRPHA